MVSMENILHASATSLADLAPDLLCTNTLTIPWGSVAAALLGKPHVWHVREFGEADHQLRFHPSFAQALRWVSESSTRIVANSEAVRATLFPHEPAGKCPTIYNHFEPPLVHPMENSGTGTKTGGTAHRGQ